MVETINPKITILQNDEYYLLFIGTMLLVFLTVTLYFSRYTYRKKYNVTNLVLQDDALTSTTSATTPIVLPNGLISCSVGKCSMDKQTGLKRCPEDPTQKIYHDPKTEVCVDKNKCIKPLVYAVNSDGSVNKNGICETGLDGCRCISDITCPVYVTSKFSVTNGSIFATFPSEKNYLVNQVPFSNKDVYGSLKTINPMNEYCKLNSTYTEKVVGGCSFANSSSDFLIDCDKESIDAEISASPYSLVPFSTEKDEKKQFCEVQEYDDSNWNNMTLCMSKNMCREGNLTYNYDKYRKNSKYAVTDNINNTINSPSTEKTTNVINSRRFCQAYSSNLSSYMSDLQYYTLSCIKGTKCNELPRHRDINKFFVGENNDFDPSGINASFPVDITVNGDVITLSHAATDSLHYHPLKNMLNNGDILSTGILSNLTYSILVNVDPDNLTAKLKNFSEKIPNKITTAAESGTYYPQFALNGFGYNTTPYTTYFGGKRYTYRGSDVYRTATPNDKPSGAENSYIPLFSILNNKTFYRGGLSKPQGYVIRNEIAEETVAEEIENQEGINSQDYKIKETVFNVSMYNKISMYNSVWNNEYGRTECIRCGPLLVATVNMARVSGRDNNTSYQYDAVTIQFSGKDFGHYRRDFLNSKWNFTSIGKISNTQSKTNKLTLTRPNFNINVGDFVISSNSAFDYDIKPLRQLDPGYDGKTCKIYIGEYDVNNNIQYSPFGDEDSLSIDNNFYEDYKQGEFKDATYDHTNNKFIFTRGTTKFMFGNIYRVNFTSNVVFQATLVPKNKVVSIDNTRKIIITDLRTNLTLQKDTDIQFISQNRNLELENELSVVMPYNPVGTGAHISVAEITDGRITSIRVDTVGTGYTNLSPKVMFKQYDQYLLNERD